MAKRTLSSARCLVTGASSGIGRELARLLVEAGARVLLTARREERLAELAGSLSDCPGQAICLPGDITCATHRQALLTEAEATWGGLDMLINNAGIGSIGPFAEADEARLRRLMEVNFFAPVELIRAALPCISRGTSPIIVNISSILAHRAVPSKSEYCASKFALHGFSDALRAELSSKAIDVLHVCPSTTASEFFDVAEGDSEKQPKLSSRPAPPEWVARKTIAAIRRGKHEILLTPGGKTLVWLDRLAPTLANSIVARLG